jgi:signal transduction histidine kinase/CheY-like chemotaxis protein
MIAPEHRQVAAENMQRTIEEGFVRNMEYSLLTKDGSRFPGELSAGVIKDSLDNPTLFVAVTKNITERKQSEEELRKTNLRLEETLDKLKATRQQVIQQERLRALGELASGIAHDFNNTLMPIMGYTDLLVKIPEVLDDRERTINYLKLMGTAAEDAANIVKRLREFYRSREEDEIFTSIDINQLIQEVIELTQPKWKDQAQADGITISIKTELQKIPSIRGNSSELREALANLIFNGVDAMTTDGTLTIRTRTGDEHVTLEVSDTGMGMTEEVKKRCLEPFFSTKEENGTGLGLSMVYGIISRHEGDIQIESEVNKGTTFIIHLPIAESHDMAITQPTTELPTRQLHVLVVDDEPAVCDLVTEYLSVDGHTYEIASNGSKALEKFRQGRFDLVITDRAMPDMGGIQLASIIKQTTPKLPIIMLTGFGDMMSTLGEMPESVDWVISKPVTLQKFREALAEVV